MRDADVIESPDRAQGHAFAARWRALHDAGQEIGALAALAPEPFDDRLAAFPGQIEAGGGAQLTLAREYLGDLDAMLQPGLVALRTLHARGQDTTAPALALWREFHASRGALLALAREAKLEEPVIAA